MKVAFVSRSQRDHGTDLVPSCTNVRAVDLAPPRAHEESARIFASGQPVAPGRHAL